MSVPKLFSPFRIGDIELSHRIIMAPLTRFRADKDHVHHDVAAEYYAQRAGAPGTLIISEATFIASEAGGFENVPGVWNDKQIASWKKVTDAVHAKGSYIFMQLWALGRAAEPEVLTREGHPYISSSASVLERKGYPNVAPRELTKAEIQKYTEYYAQAARNAVFGAGFDGVEIHGANGYLVDQFTQDTCNKRTDEYGGSIENRSRFALEVVAAVSEAVGAKRTGIRFSPWGKFQGTSFLIVLVDLTSRMGHRIGMRMKNPIPTFAYLVSEIARQHPEFAYVHFIEPVVSGPNDAKEQVYDSGSVKPNSNDFARVIWQPRPFLSAGGFTTESAFVEAETRDTGVVMGRYFISNPDLPERIRYGIALTPYNRKTFYTKGPRALEGYTDYPCAERKSKL
ncbi:NADH:flavin oxidoreductase/NADH oxidase [Rhizoctonia solani]|nr:NADH:flavin oxidoreductase/NADH oxidase [Rhizoctonia solani]